MLDTVKLAYDVPAVYMPPWYKPFFSVPVELPPVYM
jgi:hypothetical protein